MFQHLLVPHDFSEGATRALALAVRFASDQKARLTLLHVGVVPITALPIEPFAVSDLLLNLNDQIAEERRVALDRLGRADIPADVPWRAMIRDGFPPEVIVREAASGEYDLLVMGTHGRTGLGRVLLGSVAERVLRGATIPVLVTR